MVVTVVAPTSTSSRSILSRARCRWTKSPISPEPPSPDAGQARITVPEPGDDGMEMAAGAPRNQSNKPRGTALRQQKLNAWQPIFTPKAVIPTLLVVGSAFIPIGIGLLLSALQVDELVLDYTDCPSSLYSYRRCSDIVRYEANVPLWPRCTCDIKFTLGGQFKKDVFVFYQLDNFWQSLRQYASSYDPNQLYGSTSTDIAKDCEPFRTNLDKVLNRTLPIVPCGAIANSLFNDTYQMFYFDNRSFVQVPVIETGITWAVDKDLKYHNPKGDAFFSGFTKPPSWERPVWALDPSNPENNGLQNEHLMVWMRLAAFPRFRKLWARIYHIARSHFADGLPAGQYFLRVEYNFPVAIFGGRKSLVLSNTSWFGGREMFLAFGYIIVGALTIFMAIGLLVVHRLYGFNTDEMLDISSRTKYFSARKARRELFAWT